MIPAGRGVSLQVTPAEVSGPSLPWTQARDPFCIARCQHLVTRAGGKGRNLPQASGIANRKSRYINHRGGALRWSLAGFGSRHWEEVLLMLDDILMQIAWTVKPQLRRGNLVAPPG